jgi:D-beta-D-heptose 7-phosphate kinase/D-beta-D-heptose 1-phosphate adenosyltransferase
VDPLARHPPPSARPDDDRSLAALVAALAGRQLVVVGDAILDVYLRGPVDRLAREAPVPVVAVAQREEAPGGAANAALNAAALGARVRLVSAVGDDDEGERLLELLTRGGVDVAGVARLRGRRTMSKQRILVDGRALVRIDEGTTASLSAAAERGLLAALDRALPGAGAVLVSDYLCGVLTPGVLRAVGRRRTLAGTVLVADGRQLERLRAAHPSVVTPSFEEAGALLEDEAVAVGPERAELVAARSGRLLAASGAQVAVVTLDRDGALVVDLDGAAHRTPARRQVCASGTGAGDAFCAALSLALAAGAELVCAAELATLVATLAVESETTATVSAARLREDLELGGLPVPVPVAPDPFAGLGRDGALLAKTPAAAAERVRAR